MKKLLTLLWVSALTVGTQAQTTLWKSDTTRHQLYRIPSILVYGDNIIAFSDDRSKVTDATSWGDIGSVGNISIAARYSSDGGKTWSAAREIIKGFGEGTFDQGHGDAAVVRDRESGRMLLMCASGATGFAYSYGKAADNYATALRVGRYYSTDGGYTWNGGDITPQIYSIYKDGKDGKNIHRLFFTSGRICQSKLIKKGAYYRIYSALTTNEGCVVVYSDDFGNSWLPLGGADARPATDGNESKIEELPDGNVLLSCRMRGGRYFNVFTYADKRFDNGRWAEAVASTSTEGGTATLNNDTNGEILVVPAKDAGGKRVYAALQSVPRGSVGNHPTNLERRSHVSIYWKVFTSHKDMLQPAQWAGGWQRMEVTDGQSAYSTMDIDCRGNISMLYEDKGVHFQLGSQPTEMYNIMFKQFTLEDITGGQYSFSGEAKHRKAFLKQ